MSRRRRVPRFTSTTSRATSPRLPARWSRREPCLDTSPPEPRLSALYQELILDHYRRPRNKGALEGATHSVSLNNPLCGDEIGRASCRERVEIALVAGLLAEKSDDGTWCGRGGARMW